MNMYWLSILDNFIICKYCGIIGILSSVISVIGYVTSNINVNLETNSIKEKESWEKWKIGWFRILSMTFPIGIVFICLSLFVPTSDSVIKAHFMLEGRNVMTADNLEDLTEYFQNKLDNVEDKILNKMSERSEHGN